MDELARRRRERRMAAVAVVGATLLAFALGEAWVRLTWGDMIPMRVIAKELIRQGDPRLGYVLKPNVDFTLRTRLYGTVRFESNARGLRELKEVPYEKPEGERRLLAVGDSFTYGQLVNEADAYVARIERALGPGWEALNAGVMGWGTDQQVGWLLWEGLKYRPDVVALFFCIQNDFVLPGDDPSRRVFALQDGRVVENPGDKSWSWRGRSAFNRYVLDRSDLNWFLRIKLTQLRNQLTEGLRAPDAALVPYRLDYPKGDEEEGFALTTALIAHARDAAAAAGAKFLLATVDSAGVHEAIWRQFLAQYEVDPKDYGMRHAEDVLRKFAEEEGIAFVALSEALAAYPDEAHFLPEDGHYTPEAHARAAGAVVAKLRALGWA
ncbi:MAG: hypothetical protein K8I02_01590, partial [Candidatus Methylomirabilis sp.]|nr:hypothetical protein [Deltaproteobacteria bacterium]